MPTLLSVNLNKIALLRNSRGRNYPSVSVFADRCLEYGAAGITLHPRPDQRHARYSDLLALRPLSKDHNAELNIEGYPTEEFLRAVLDSHPDQCTLVPDSPEQLTSDHGWDLESNADFLQPIIQQLRDANIRTSLFMDADNLSQYEILKQLGADRLELYTESYAEAFGKPEQIDITDQYRAAAEAANSLALGINAGHDLNLQNLESFISNVPNVLEVSIGHALITEALDMGMKQTVEAYCKILKQA